MDSPVYGPEGGYCAVFGFLLPNTDCTFRVSFHSSPANVLPNWPGRSGTFEFKLRVARKGTNMKAIKLLGFHGVTVLSRKPVGLQHHHQIAGL
jgi:hypothetical protein